MKRLLIALLLACAPVLAWAESCISNCAADTPCDANAAGSWTGCTRSNDDTFTIGSGDHMVVTAALSFTAPSTISAGASLGFDPTASSRTNGVLTLTMIAPAADVDPDLTINGKLIMRAGDRIAVDTSAPATDAVFDIDPGAAGVMDLQGLVYETTIARMSTVIAGADGTCGSGAASGRLYEIVPESGFEFARDDRRVVFMSGRSRGQHLEIIGFADTDGDSVNDAIRLCSHLNAALSGGQRLDIHGADDNAIHAGIFDNLHSVPIQFDSTITTDARFDPAVGDKIAIIDDWWIYQSAGTGGLVIRGPSHNSETLPDWRAGMIADFGEVAADDMITFGTPNTGERGGLSFMNFRDWQGTGPVISLAGIQDSIFEWNYWHSAAQVGDVDSSAAISVTVNLAGNAPPHRNTFRDNRLVRLVGGGFGVEGSAGLVRVEGTKIERNFCGDICNSTTDVECGCTEISGVRNAYIKNNVFFNGCNATGSISNTRMLGFSGATAGIELENCWGSDNWVVNTCGEALATPAVADQANRCTWVHNYVSHVGSNAARPARYYSNLIKNYGYVNNLNVVYALNNPNIAKGNFIIAADPEVWQTGCVLAADCIAVGDPDNCCTGAGVGATCTGCGARGIYLTEDTGNAGDCNTGTGLCVTGGHIGTACTVDADCGGIHAEIQDNVIASFHHNTTGRSIYVDIGSQRAHYDITVDHITFDGHEENQTSINVGGAPSSIAPHSTTTWAFSDLLALGNGNAGIGSCLVGPAGMSENFGANYSYRNFGGPTFGGSLTVTNCEASSATVLVQGGNLKGARQFDYNLVAGAAELTAGSGGGPVGTRVWRFDPGRLNDVWAGILPFDGIVPPNICNLPNEADGRINDDCQDSDGDGIPNLHDNCDFTPNPGQVDGDGDGVGCECDNGDACP